MFRLRNITNVGNEWVAELYDCNYRTTIPIIIQRGGGNCGWVAINRTNRTDMWEIISVGNGNENIENWQNEDIVQLGVSIK